MNKKTLVIILAAVVVLAAAAFFYWYKKTGTGPVNIIDDVTKGVLPSINTNPLENKPDINPADKTNPYTNIKTNPF